jgi:hypothetical protein
MGQQAARYWTFAQGSLQEEKSNHSTRGHHAEIPGNPLSFHLAAFAGRVRRREAGDFVRGVEKRMDEFAKTLQADVMKAARANASGDKKTVCQTTSSILSTARPMFKAASSCNSISAAVGLNKLIRTMEEMRQASGC